MTVESASAPSELSCQAAPAVVKAGAGVTVTATANGFEPIAIVWDWERTPSQVDPTAGRPRGNWSQELHFTVVGDYVLRGTSMDEAARVYTCFASFTVGE